ncbi:CRISPR-associated endonuclease Cas3'' [Desulfovibrio sp. IOR2]|uniref:CRISPR-associated endonuclease Cas3'' n=1 Tax=Salidesulfovibrio onnuriiensis TaxID=2583823 RepID=UPI0011C91536
MNYWGKSYSDGRWHELRNHCLDVAATFEAFLTANPLLVNTIETLSPCARMDIQRLLVFFASVHDIGKFSLSFQNLVPELARKLGHDSSTRYEHHTVLGLNVWPTLPAVQESALLNSYVCSLSFFSPLWSVPVSPCWLSPG